MSIATVDRSDHVGKWQFGLVAAGIIMILAAAALEVVMLSYHSTTLVKTQGHVVKTITGPAAPPSDLVTFCLGAGIVLLLAGAFFSRISKIVIPGGGELDFETQAALASKIAAKTGNDGARAKRAYERAAPLVSASISRKLSSVPVSTVHLTSAELDDIVEKATTE